MFLPAGGIARGQVGIISDGVTMPVAPAVQTGVLVIYADDDSFSFMSPEGHPFAGPLTFSAFADDDGCTVVQVQEFTRASDPLYELMMHTPVLGDRFQNEIWRSTLRNVARHFGVDAPVEQQIDRHGVEWIQPTVPLAHPLDDGSAVLLERDIGRTAMRLGRDGAAWSATIGAIARDWTKLRSAVTGPILGLHRHPLALARF